MFRKNVAGQNIPFIMVSATTGAALTGATVSGYRSIDGGAQAAVTGTITEKANGQYNLAASQADMNGNQIGFLFTASGAIPQSITISTTAADPTNATTYGIGNLDAAISSRSTYAGGAVASVTAAVTVGTNNDKTGYALTAGEHTAMATDTQTGMTAQGYTTTRAGYLDTLNGLVAAIWNALTSGFATTGSIGLKLKNWVLGSDNKAAISTDAQDLSATLKVDAKVVEDKTGYSLSVTPPTAVQVRMEMDANSTKLTNLDAAISTRLAGSAYTAPDNADITTIKSDIESVTFGLNALLTKINLIPTNPLLTNDARMNNLDAAISSRLATSGYTAPDNSDIIAVKNDIENVTYGVNALYDQINAIPTNPLLANDSRLNNLDSDLATIAGNVSQVLDRISNLSVVTRLIVVPSMPASFLRADAGDHWVKFIVNLFDTSGVPMDSKDSDATATDTVVNYNGFGVEAEFEDGTNLVLYNDDLTTPLTLQSTCHHSAATIKPQVLIHDSTGVYHFWVNLKSTQALGNYTLLFGWFDHGRAAAGYTIADHKHEARSFEVVASFGIDGVQATANAIQADVEHATYGLNALLTAINSRLATNAYTAPDNSNIGAIKADLESVVSGLSALLAAINSRLAASSYVAPDNASIVAIKSKTDQLTITDGKVDANATASVDESAIAAAILNAPLDGHTDSGTVGEKLNNAGSSSVVLPVMQGSVYSAVAVQSQTVSIVRGDTPKIYFDLGADYLGWTASFGAKLQPADVEYVIPVKECTWTDATKGQGYVELSSTDTASSGRIFAEIELVNGAAHLTAMKFTLIIVEDIIK